MNNRRCFANIGGWVVASAGGTFVTGGWSLAVTLAGKGYALFSLIDSCVTAYKEGQVKYVAPEKLEPIGIDRTLFESTELLKEGERLDMLKEWEKLIEYGNR